MISPLLLKLRWKSLTAHLQQKWQTALNVYIWVQHWQQTGELRAAVYVLPFMWNVNVKFLLKTFPEECLLHDRFTFDTVNSSERLLKPLHSHSGAVWWSTRQMLVEVSYYIDISTKKKFSVYGHILIRVLWFTPSFVDVNTWSLSAVLMGASRDLYFFCHSQLDSKLTGFQQWLTFLLSRHLDWHKQRQQSRQAPSTLSI